MHTIWPHACMMCRVVEQQNRQTNKVIAVVESSYEYTSAVPVQISRLSGPKSNLWMPVCCCCACIFSGKGRFSYLVCEACYWCFLSASRNLFTLGDIIGVYSHVKICIQCHKNQIEVIRGQPKGERHRTKARALVQTKIHYLKPCSYLR